MIKNYCYTNGINITDDYVAQMASVYPNFYYNIENYYNQNQLYITEKQKNDFTLYLMFQQNSNINDNINNNINNNKKHKRTKGKKKKGNYG